VYAVVQIRKPIGQTFAVFRPGHPVHPWRGILLEPVVGLLQQGHVDVVQQAGEPFPFPVSRCFAYARQPL
jgi:hypothetical protein